MRRTLSPKDLVDRWGVVEGEVGQRGADAGIENSQAKAPRRDRVEAEQTLVADRRAPGELLPLAAIPSVQGKLRDALADLDVLGQLGDVEGARLTQIEFDGRVGGPVVGGLVGIGIAVGDVVGGEGGIAALDVRGGGLR